MGVIVIGGQFKGPPNSGNGGYVCGLLARDTAGPATAVLRAPIPLDTDLALERGDERARLQGLDGALIAESGPGRFDLPEAPPSPGVEAARAAGARYIGHTQRSHPICFTCGTERDEGDGLRVFPGPLDGAAPGVVACEWVPHPAFAEADGTIPPEVIWAALDCPGFFAWVEQEGRHGALLGTMTGEVIRRPRAGEPCVVVAWTLEREGRKETSGVALYDATGELLAHGHQVWIMMGPRPGPTAAAA